MTDPLYAHDYVAPAQVIALAYGVYSDNFKTDQTGATLLLAINNLSPRVLNGVFASEAEKVAFAQNHKVVGVLKTPENQDGPDAIAFLNLTTGSIELRLTRRAASGWYGGFSLLLKEAGMSMADVEFAANDNEVVQDVAA